MSAASLAPLINAFVVLPRAETTTTTFCSAEEFATIFNTLSIFFELATDEPPNFNTFILKKFENFILNYFDTIEI